MHQVLILISHLMKYSILEKLEEHDVTIHKSWTKTEKVNILDSIIGDGTTIEPLRLQRKISSLRQLASAVIS